MMSITDKAAHVKLLKRRDEQTNGRMAERENRTRPGCLLILIIYNNGCLGKRELELPRSLCHIDSVLDSYGVKGIVQWDTGWWGQESLEGAACWEKHRSKATLMCWKPEVLLRQSRQFLTVLPTVYSAATVGWEARDICSQRRTSCHRCVSKVGSCRIFFSAKMTGAANNEGSFNNRLVTESNDNHFQPFTPKQTLSAATCCHLNTPKRIEIFTGNKWATK